MMNPPLRYSDLKPKLTEGNLFTYHLKKLINERLIRKVGDRYELTAAGKLRADQLSLATFSEPMQPKIVTLIICRNETGEYLLYKRNREPFRGLLGFPHGKVHLGERVAEAAERELQEKTGLTAELIRRGEAYVTVYSDGELVSQTLFHVFSGTNPTGKLIGKTKIGQSFWKKIDQSNPLDYSPGVLDIYHEIEKDSPTSFFTEVIYQL